MDLPKESALLPPLCIWRMKKIQKPIRSRKGAQEMSMLAQVGVWSGWYVDRHLLGEQACRRACRSPCGAKVRKALAGRRSGP